VVDFGLLLMAAIAVVGLIEYTKGWWKSAPSWVWRAFSPIACVLAAIGVGGGWRKELFEALVLLAICELAYQTIVAAIPKLIDSAIGKSA
jgi:hypothetical protein